MAPQLWLLRHGEAVPHESKPDDERELTARGERQALAAGAALARLGAEFSAGYTSPMLRARQTAELACRALGIEPVVEESVGYGFDRDDAIALLRAHGDDARVLVVGHEPDFSQVVHDFTGGRVDFKKGGIAAVREARGSGELLVLLRPRELETMALEET
ncbi:MAG TPA: histidine phosphatase family protein [Solirubrobacteraceae bacterium]|nr:histidine phosphatase family protein [Solirubrobacteraceae bacterium]